MLLLRNGDGLRDLSLHLVELIVIKAKFLECIRVVELEALQNALKRWHLIELKVDFLQHLAAYQGSDLVN